jgi:hypothetical protein
MPEDTSQRMALSVGRREFEELTGSWGSYLEVAQPKTGSTDPVLAMRHVGFVLRALEQVLATAVKEPEHAEEDQHQ